jgi:hypothetical protein
VVVLTAVIGVCAKEKKEPSTDRTINVTFMTEDFKDYIRKVICKVTQKSRRPGNHKLTIIV